MPIQLNEENGGKILVLQVSGTLVKGALSENSTRGPFHAAFRNTTNSVLVTAMR